MKRIIVRCSILMLLGAAILWISSEKDARAFSCVSLSQMWDDMATCDGNFWSGASPYYDVIQNNPNNCDQQAANQCAHLLGQPGYSSCYSSAYNSCVNSAETNYYSALSGYSSCLWEANNPDCFEELEFCPGAIDRANQCEQFANDPGTAYSECRNASGIGQCQ